VRRVTLRQRDGCISTRALVSGTATAGAGGRTTTAQRMMATGGAGAVHCRAVTGEKKGERRAWAGPALRKKTEQEGNWPTRKEQV
jgi:hypothetical protein